MKCKRLFKIFRCKALPSDSIQKSACPNLRIPCSSRPERPLALNVIRQDVIVLLLLHYSLRFKDLIGTDSSSGALLAVGVLIASPVSRKAQ
jgi:hypothetical protein